MDLRTKLVFSLVGVALISMASLGTVAYVESRQLLRESSLRQLDALAESRKQQLEAVVSDWGDHVLLIGNRAQLRDNLAAGTGELRDDNRARIETLLRDAIESVPGVRVINVFDAGGRPVASTKGALDRQLSPVSGTIAPDDDEIRFLGLSDESGELRAKYLMSISALEIGRVGWLEASLAADDIIELVGDTTGLGPTGETIVVVADGDTYRVLHPTRHSPADSHTPPSRGAPVFDPADLAIAGVDTMVYLRAVDYRGVPVWAATRFVDELGWGVVVKVDAAQEDGPIRLLREKLVRGSLTFAAFAILAGILLGLHLARPIHDLAEMANRIREGDMDVRAKIHHRDEIGMLARTFNRMAEALAAKHVDLSTTASAEHTNESEEPESS